MFPNKPICIEYIDTVLLKEEGIAGFEHFSSGLDGHLLFYGKLSKQDNIFDLFDGERIEVDGTIFIENFRDDP